MPNFQEIFLESWAQVRLSPYAEAQEAADNNRILMRFPVLCAPDPRENFGEKAPPFKLCRGEDPRAKRTELPADTGAGPPPALHGSPGGRKRLSHTTAILSTCEPRSVKKSGGKVPPI